MRESSETKARKLLMPHRKQFRVNSSYLARVYFDKYVDYRGWDNCYYVRFVELPESRAIELQASDEMSLNHYVRLFKDAKIIKKELPFEVNKIIKMTTGRREGRDFSEGHH